jgi:hypothetical protein
MDLWKPRRWNNTVLAGLDCFWHASPTRHHGNVLRHEFKPARRRYAHGGAFLSNLMYGGLLSVALDWAGSTTWLDGMKRGAVIGLLMTAAYDLNFYAMTTMFLVPTGIFVDMLIFSFLMACSGGVIGFVYGKLNK